MDRCESNYSQRGHDWRWLNCRDGSCGYEGCPTLLNCGWQPRERKFAEEHFWTWEERMGAEVHAVKALLR